MAIIRGDNTSEVINGTNSADTIYGYGGNDLIRGLNGNDRIYGGAGDDDIYGGLGTNDLYGGTGADWFIMSARGVGASDDRRTCATPTAEVRRRRERPPTASPPWSTGSCRRSATGDGGDLGAHVDHAIGLEDTHRLADRGAGRAERLAQFALGRQRVTDPEIAGVDQRLDLPDQGFYGGIIEVHGALLLARAALFQPNDIVPGRHDRIASTRI